MPQRLTQQQKDAWKAISPATRDLYRAKITAGEMTPLQVAKHLHVDANYVRGLVRPTTSGLRRKTSVAAVSYVKMTTLQRYDELYNRYAEQNAVLQNTGKLLAVEKEKLKSEYQAKLAMLDAAD